MTDEPISRRSLSRPLSAVQSPVSPVLATTPPQAVVAARHGFDAIPVPASELERLQSQQKPEKLKRQRGAGRDQNFTVKLRIDTHAYIYTQANARNIPIAQVIEELVEAHKAMSGIGQ